MSYFLNYLIQRKLLCFLCIVFFLLRLPFLDQVFLLHDERDISYSGYSIAKTGKDIYGSSFPLSFNNVAPDNPMVAIYYSAIWWLFIPFISTFTARLPYVFITSFFIFIVFELIYVLTNKKNISLLTTIIFCFSPWIFHISRLALDISLAMVTLLLGMIFYLKKRPFIAYILFLLTFYNYQGFRVLIPFLLIYLESFFYLQHKKVSLFFKRNIKNLLFVLILMASILIVDADVTRSRFKQVAFLNLENFAFSVDYKRNTSFAPSLLKKAFHNKVTQTFDYILDNFFMSQDVTYLFKKGDNSAINGNVSTGQFFPPFLIFFYLGIIYFAKKSNSKDLYPLGFIAIGVLPALASLHGPTFSIRAMLQAVGFSYLLSCGFIFGLQLLSKIKINLFRYTIIICMITLLTVSIAYFIYNYYYRRPVIASEHFNENEKRLSEYLITKGNNGKFFVYHKYPREIYLSYAFLNKKTNIHQMQLSLTSKKDLRTNNLIFYNCEERKDFFIQKPAIIFEQCLNKKEYDQLSLKTNIRRIRYHDTSLKTAYFIIR